MPVRIARVGPRFVPSPQPWAQYPQLRIIERSATVDASPAVNPGITRTGWLSPRPTHRSSGEDANNAPISNTADCSRKKRRLDGAETRRRVVDVGASLDDIAPRYPRGPGYSMIRETHLH